jgi:release factor glutamine methyltransferase
MQDIRRMLKAGGIEDAAAEARILAAGVLGLSRTDLFARGDMPIEEPARDRLLEAVARRLKGEPPYRILGQRPFFGLEFKLSKGTLEPRPDTEVLVDTVLGLLSDRRDEPLALVDLGTGTGAISLALLAHLPAARAVGVDLDPDALATAAENAALNGLSERFSTAQSNWFDDISGTFDVIVSNPPYIRSEVIPGLDREVREHDPHLALDGGVDGLDAYREIARRVHAFLRPGGLVAVEIGYDQQGEVEAIFAQHGLEMIRAVRDLGGRDRVLAFRLSA